MNFQRNVRGPTMSNWLIFFFQAEDGIRDYKVTGVQTCALPIYAVGRVAGDHVNLAGGERAVTQGQVHLARALGELQIVRAREALVAVLARHEVLAEIGRAWCRERV